MSLSFDSFTDVLASKYAKALYVIAEGEGEVFEFLEEVKAVRKSLESIDDGERLFNRFSLMPKDGELLIDTLADELRLRIEIKNFLKIILWNHRFSEVLNICKSFEDICDEMKGLVFHVTFAEGFSEEKKQELRNVLKRASADNSDVKIIEDLDDSLIGGFQVRHKSKLVDCSVKSKLSRLRATLRGRA